MGTRKVGLVIEDDLATNSLRFGGKFVSIFGLTLKTFFFLAFLSGFGLVVILLATLAVSDSSLKMSGGDGGCE